VNNVFDFVIKLSRKASCDPCGQPHRMEHGFCCCITVVPAGHRHIHIWVLIIWIGQPSSAFVGLLVSNLK